MEKKKKTTKRKMEMGERGKQKQKGAVRALERGGDKRAFVTNIVYRVAQCTHTYTHVNQILWKCRNKKHAHAEFLHSESSSHKWHTTSTLALNRETFVTKLQSRALTFKCGRQMLLN